MLYERKYWSVVFPVQPEDAEQKLIPSTALELILRHVSILTVVFVSGRVSWVHVRACSIVYLGYRDFSSRSELYNDGTFFLFQAALSWLNGFEKFT